MRISLLLTLVSQAFCAALLCGGCGFLDHPWIGQEFVLEGGIGAAGVVSGAPACSGALLTGEIFVAVSEEDALSCCARLGRGFQLSTYADSASLGWKRVVQNDLLGDPVSFACSFNYVQSCSYALKNRTLFHRAPTEVEWILSCGKEWVCWDQWNTRLWGTLAPGVGSRGSPWVRVVCGVEQRYGRGWVHLSIEGIVGLGTVRFHAQHFRGYGNIAYRALDATVGWYHEVAPDAQIAIELGARVCGVECVRQLETVRFVCNTIF